MNEQIMSKDDYKKLKSIAKEIESLRDKYNFTEITIQSKQFTSNDLIMMIRAKCQDDFKYANINNGYQANYEEFCGVCDKEYCRMKGTWC